MASDRLPEQHPTPQVQRCPINFSARWHGVDLRKLDTHELDLLRDLPRGYQAVLDRKESFARHFDVALISVLVEGALREAFGGRNPYVVPSADPNHRSSTPGWIDVLREVQSTQLGPTANGPRRFHVSGALVQLDDPDCESIRTGILQKVVNALTLPHANDVQAELDTIRSITSCFCAWNANILQTLKENEALLEGLKERTNELQHYLGRSPLPQSLTCDPIVSPQAHRDLEPNGQREVVTLGHPFNTHGPDPQDSSANGSPQASNDEEGFSMNEPGQEGRNALQARPSSTPNNRARWPQREESRLLPWLRAHTNLSWSQKSQEYLRDFGIYRSGSTLRKKALRMENNGSRNTRRLRMRGGRRENKLLVSLPLPPGRMSTDTIEPPEVQVTATRRSSVQNSPTPGSYVSGSRTHDSNSPNSATDGERGHTSSMLSPMDDGVVSSANTSSGRDQFLSLGNLLH